jgi:hypothetical protein
MDTAAVPQETERARYIRAVLCEIRMLVDYLAASSLRTLNEVQINDPATTPATTLNSSELLLRLDEIEVRTTYQGHEPSDLAIIQTARDALGRLVRPASGLTVAYTALVIGNRRGRGSQSRATLAQEAYPGLVNIAITHRWALRLLLVLAVFLTFSAVWESAKVALGKSLLENLAGLRTEQTAVAAEKARLEATLDNLPNGILTAGTILNQGHIVPAAFDLCDRGKALEYSLKSDIVPKDSVHHLPLPISSSPMIRDVCRRESALAQKIAVLHSALISYQTYWPGMVGNSFRVVAQLASIPCRLLACRSTPNAELSNGQSVEFAVTPELLVWGNYILPVIFGFLGAAIFVILDFFGKIRDGRLDPRDNFLGWIRLVLGLVTGAAIGLFFSAYSPPPAPSGAANNLIGSLALSASAVAFLAGFGVEGVFSMLESLVTRIFAPERGRAGEAT